MQLITQNHKSSKVLLKSDLLYNVKKICVYHTGALGDLLISTAAIYEICRYFPKAKVTIIGCELWKQILLPNIWLSITEILACDKGFSHCFLYEANLSDNDWKLKKDHIAFKTFLKSFDLAIDLRSESLRFILRSFIARVPSRIGASKYKIIRFLFTHFKQQEKNTSIHERDRYLDILSSLPGFENIILNNDWQKKALPKLAHFDLKFFEKSTQIKTISELILINPTASIREKAWPAKNFFELALQLEKKGHKIAIIGSPQESVWLQEVSCEKFPCIQPKSIQELINVVSGAKLVIANTSSVQFIAASAQIPLLTLIGTASPARWGPIGSKSHYIKKTGYQLPIFKKCTNKKIRARISEGVAYAAISVEDVLNALNRILF